MVSSYPTFSLGEISALTYGWLFADPETLRYEVFYILGYNAV
jgi:hypothetical protein